MAFAVDPVTAPACQGRARWHRRGARGPRTAGRLAWIGAHTQPDLKNELQLGQCTALNGRHIATRATVRVRQLSKRALVANSASELVRAVRKR